MNSKTLVVITALLILSLLTNFYLAAKTSNQNANPNKPFSFNSNTAALPIDPSHKGVTSAVYNYTLTGTLTKVETKGSNTKIMLDISDQGIPPLTVSNTSVVMDTREDKPKEVSGSSLKVGEKVSVGINYDASRKALSVSFVTILSL